MACELSRLFSNSQCRTEREMLPWRTVDLPQVLLADRPAQLEESGDSRLPACMSSHTGLHTPDLHPACHKDLMKLVCWFTQQRVYFSLVT